MHLKVKNCFDFAGFLSNVLKNRNYDRNFYFFFLEIMVGRRFLN